MENYLLNRNVVLFSCRVRTGESCHRSNGSDDNEMRFFHKFVFTGCKCREEYPVIKMEASYTVFLNI